MRTAPEVGGMTPVIIRIVVDFPAPFGPKKPKISPRLTVNETPFTARLGPNSFMRFSTWIIDSMVGAILTDLTDSKLSKHRFRVKKSQDIRRDS